MLDQKNILEKLDRISEGTMAKQIGIEFTEVGDSYLCGKMPVDSRTKQPLGLLHGGASVALAETLASVAGTLQVDHEKQYCVGVEINANHIKSVNNGFVYGKASPINIRKKIQVWEIRITDDEGDLVCISRMTLAVLNR